MRTEGKKFFTLDEEIINLWQAHGWKVKSIRIPRGKKCVWEIEAEFQRKGKRK